MLIIQLNDRMSYCHDGVYAFFEGPGKARARATLGNRLERAEHFSSRLMPVQEACDQFRAALQQAEAEISGLRLAWTTAQAQAIAQERGLTLSDAELWHVSQDKADAWSLYRYGSFGFDAHPDDHPVWLVNSWLANLANVANPERSSYLQLLPTQVVEVNLTQVQDADLGTCWEAQFEVFRRQQPRDPGVDRFFLAAAGDATDLHQDLVHQAHALEAHTLRYLAQDTGV